MKNPVSYTIKHEDDKLYFSTPFFKAERTSVLHPGVYTNEFSSMLLSGAACIVAYMLTESMAQKYSVLRYALLLLILIISFAGGKKYIFREKHLEALFNKADKSVTIKKPRILFIHKTETIPFTSIKSIELETKVFKPQNIDGVNFVQKISLQHGSAVPGLGIDEEFITVNLKLNDDSARLLFAGKTDAEPEIPLKEIRTFLQDTV